MERDVLKAYVSLDLKGAAFVLCWVLSLPERTAFVRRESPVEEGLPLLPDDVCYSSKGDDPRCRFHDHTAQHPHRPEDVNDHAGIGDEGSQRDFSSHDHERPDSVSHQHLKSAQQVRYRPKEGVGDYEFPSPAEFLPVVPLELPHFEVPSPKSLYHPDAGEILLKSDRKHRFLVLVALIGGSNPTSKKNRKHDDHWDGNN